MNKVLIHKSNEQLLVTHFTSDLGGGDIRKEADKILKFGQCFRIEDVSNLPEDKLFRGAWEIEDAELNDGVAGEWISQNSLNMFSELKSFHEKELNDQKQRLSDLPEMIKQKEEEIKTKNELIEASPAESAELEEKLSELDTELQDLKNSGEEINEDGEPSEKLINLEEEIIETRTLINSKYFDSKNAKSEITQLELEIADFKKELESLSEKISTTESEIRKFSEDILDAETKINQLQEILPLDKRRSSND